MTDEKNRSNSDQTENATGNRSLSVVPRFRINSHFPLFWVVASQPIMLLLIANDQFAAILLKGYDLIVINTIVFSKFNTNYPFSSDLAKSYTSAMVLLIPLQLLALFRADHKELAKIFWKKDDKGLFHAFLFIATCFLIFTTLLPPSVAGIVRLLGGGLVAASLVIPMLTSLFPLLIRISSYFLFEK